MLTSPTPASVIASVWRPIEGNMGKSLISLSGEKANTRKSNESNTKKQ
jgi:hypothetical protein